MAAFVPPKDRVLETSISNSQTVFALAGAVDASFNRFSASMAVGDTTIGAVVEPGVAFKSGKLTYSAANEITIDSTGFESKGTFSSGGTKEVFMGLPAKSAFLVDGPQSLSAGQKLQARSNIDVPGLASPNSFTDATDATSSTAGGAMTLAGGLAVAKKMFVGGAINAVGTVSSGGVVHNQSLSNSVPAVDASGTGLSVASGANARFANSGTAQLVLMRENTSGGAWCLAVLANNAVTIIAQSGSNYVAGTSSPGAGNIGLFFNGSTGFNIANGLAVTCSFSAIVLRGA